MCNACRFKAVPKFLGRYKLRLVALLLISAAGLVAVHEYYHRPALIRDTYDDDVVPEILDHVFQRWYNFTAGEKKWYNNESVSMFDERLVAEMGATWIVKKSDLVVSYTLLEPEVRDPSMGQARAIMEILGNKRHGFFIECGAYDGETRSNTLMLERYFGWSGILIEADPINFTKMLNKNRKAQMSPSCLSVRRHPMNVSFLMARNIGRIHVSDHSATNLPENNLDVAHSGRHITVQCFPLASYVAALGVKTVDYLSLDIEGSEMDVLKTIPFDKIDIKTLSVEYIHVNKSRRYMIEFMEKRGYYVYSFVTHPDNLANDVIFAKKGS